MSDSRLPPTSVVAVLALVLLSLQGLALRHLITVPYNWVVPHIKERAHFMPRGAEEAPDWPTVLQFLSERRPDARLLSLLETGRRSADSVRLSYVSILDVLTPEQRTAVEEPQSDLVDPLFPGIDGNTRPLVDYCIVSLGEEIEGPSSRRNTEKPGAETSDPPMPETVLWGLTRLSLLGGRVPLSTEQKGELVARLRETIKRVRAYHAARVSVSEFLALPPVHSELRAVNFPTPQELRRVARELGTLLQDPVR